MVRQSPQSRLYHREADLSKRLGDGQSQDLFVIHHKDSPSPPCQNMGSFRASGGDRVVDLRSPPWCAGKKNLKRRPLSGRVHQTKGASMSTDDALNNRQTSAQRAAGY